MNTCIKWIYTFTYMYMCMYTYTCAAHASHRLSRNKLSHAERNAQA